MTNLEIKQKLDLTRNTKRTCSLCGLDCDGISAINDRRGICLGLFGPCCYPAVNQAVNDSPPSYRCWRTNEEAFNWIITKAKEIKEQKGFSAQTV